MSDLPPDLSNRGWAIKQIGKSNISVLVKLFSFSADSQFLQFSNAVNRLEKNNNHHGELSIYEGLDRVRYAVFTHEPEPMITESDFRVARQIETYYTNMMKEGVPKPALFLDFDGTVRDVVEDPARAKKGGFRAPYCLTEVEVFPQVSDILEMWDESGYFLVGATNQSGVGRGDLTEGNAVECINETVNQIGIGFPVFYSTAKKTADYKPAIGMGLDAIEQYGPFDLENSIMVGDNHRQGDENFAYNLGIQFIHANDFFHLTSDQQGRPNPFAAEIEPPLKGVTTENPYQIKIYVPSTVIDTPISQEKHESRVKNTQRFLSSLFGGYTSAEVTGGYYSNDDGLISEPVVVVSSWATPENYQQHKGKIERFIKTKQKEWGQEAIGFEFEDDFFMFPEFSAEMDWFSNAQANIKKYVENNLMSFSNYSSEEVQEVARDYYEWLDNSAHEFNVERNKYFTCTTSLKPEMKQCYYNSLRYTWEDPDAQYYEGWVVSSQLGLPIRHAWVVSEGQIYDPTFDVVRKQYDEQDVDYAYWGVEIPQMFITERVIETEKSGPYLFDYFFYTSAYVDIINQRMVSRLMESFLADDFSYEYQPSQTLTDYSPEQLMESSAIEGYQPLKYSVMRQNAETYAAESDEKKEEARLKKYTKTYGEKGAKIRNRIFKRILKNKQDGTKAGQWSARKAQSLTEDYEKAMKKKGLKAYKSGKKTKSQKSLKRWGDQDWKTKSGKKSSKTGERYLPAEAIKALTDKEYKKTSAKKKRDTKKGKQFSDQPKDVANKVKKYRAETPDYYIDDDDWLDLMPPNFNPEVLDTDNFKEIYYPSYPLMVIPNERWIGKTLRSRYLDDMIPETKELFSKMEEIYPVVVIRLLEDDDIYDEILVAGHLRSHIRGLKHETIPTVVLEMKEEDWNDDYEAETFNAESMKPYSVEISRSTNDEKKLMAVFSDEEGDKIKTTHFGQRGASDYTKHGEKERMERYLERHGGGTTTSTKEDWKDPTTAGSLSRWILWNKPDLKASFNDYKRRFNLEGELKVKRS
jgi:HAD superfamily hydrolase (TIGR01662 family)